MKRSIFRFLLVSTAWLAFSSSIFADDRPDLLVADFEAETFEPWVAEGAAFGKSPAKGAWPGQMAVEGFEGRGLVNSFRGGDDSTGTLTSPPFRVERTHLNFLIGGGKFPGETCLDLLLDGVVVRSATGPNDRPGGSERLEWASWDVADLVGKSVVLRVFDRRKGGWGHINVDQIVQSDRSRGMVDRALEIVVRSRYLALPIDRKAPVRRVKVSDGSLSREFDIKLAEGLGDFSTYLDLSKFASKTLKIEARLPGDSTCFERLTQVDAIPDASKIHHEPGRPGFHFTSARGWLNDPNGLVFFEGEYHLFYQHNPYGWDWGNMHWGHAVSPDLIHWEELPIAIFPKNYGDWAFSGSAVVDRSNTSGFGTATNPPLVAAYTSTGRGECIVFSLDRGRTWTEFDGNPVVKHAGRDPRLLWHEPTHRWVMAVYDETDGRRDVAIYSSPDLKAWTFESRIGGFYECPDLFELPVQGTPEQKFWVLLAADGAYLLGQFDGKTFHLSGPTAKQKLWHGNFYAAQTFSDEPKGRRVQIGWAQGIEFPGEPFNQQMNVPCELTLRSTPQGIRLFAEPVAELAKLRIGDPSVAKGSGAGEGVLSAHLQASEYFDLQLIALGTQAGDLTLTLPGATLSYDGLNRILTCNGEKVRLDQNQSGLKLRILVDRGSIEVFGNDGIVAISKGLTKRSSLDQDVRLKFESYGVRSGTQRSFSIELYPLKSSWRWCLRIAERDKFLVNMKLTT